MDIKEFDLDTIKPYPAIIVGGVRRSGKTRLTDYILNEIFETRGQVLDRFIFLYRRIQEGIQQYKSLYIMIHGLVYGPPEGVPDYDFAGFQRCMLDAVKRIYSEGVASGEIRNVDADEVAFLVLGLIDYSLNMDMVLPEMADSKRPERLLRLAFKGLSRG